MPLTNNEYAVSAVKNITLTVSSISLQGFELSVKIEMRSEFAY